MYGVIRIIGAAALLAAATTLGACQATETAPAPTSAPGGSPAPAAVAPAETGLSGEDFLSKAESLSGTTVTLGRCSLLTTPGGDGTLPCRVLDNGGADIKDSSGLPVDIFIKQADLSPGAKAAIAGCDGFCTVQISGKLDRATDGTGFLSMTDVSLTVID